MSAQAPQQGSVGALLGARAIAEGGCEALAAGDRAIISYAQLERLAEGLATRLSRFAGRPLRGERVVIVAPNQPVLPIALFATWLTGAVAVPLSARLREYELRRILGDAQPVVVVSVAEHGGYSFANALATIAEELPAVRGCLIVNGGDASMETEIGGGGIVGARDAAALEDPGVAAILYTSGTTGEPKGALISHACLLAEARNLSDLLDLAPRDIAVLPIPVTHAFGIACLLAAVAAGAVTVLVDPGVSLAPVIEAAQRRGATVMHGSPALFSGMLKAHPDKLEPVRTGLIGGAAPPPGLLEQLEGRGPRVLNVFGMTELGAACACRLDDPPSVRYETAGRPLSGYELRAVDDELQVRGPFVTSGYYHRPDLTAPAFAAGGWFRTGDLGSIDEQGNLRLVGRAKELANVGGFNVFPGEVEAVLLAHPDVAQAAVVAVPHQQLGEALKAVVVARPGGHLVRGELLRYLRGRIAGYKVPYAIELAEELPLLASGKPDRSALGAS